MEAEKEEYGGGGGKHDDGLKAEFKHYMTKKGVSKSLDNEGLGETLKAGKNKGGLEKPLDDSVSESVCCTIMSASKLTILNILSHMLVVCF